VTIVDVAPPVVFCPPSLVLAPNQVTPPFANGTAVDNIDGPVPLTTVNLYAGQVLPVGSYAQYFYANDSSGNVANCTAYVDVVNPSYAAPSVTFQVWLIPSKPRATPTDPFSRSLSPL
jgi:hypothetical protein